VELELSFIIVYGTAKCVIIIAFFHVLQKEDNDCMEKCLEYEAEGSRPKRTWRVVAEKDCEACKLNKEGAVDRSRWRKLIRDVMDVSGWIFLLVSAHPVSLGQRAVKRLCVCVCDLL